MNHLDGRRRSGGTSPALLLLLAIVLGVGGLLAWLFLADNTPHPTPSLTAATKATDEPSNDGAPPVEPERVADVLPGRVPDDHWQKAMKEAGTIVVRDPKTNTKESRPIYTLEGSVVSDRDDADVYYFMVWMIPEALGDPVKAKNSISPSHFRNGKFRLEHQLGGNYNMIVESREHEAVTRTITVPFEGGPLQFRLKSGTSICGIVRDGHQTPIEEMEIHLQVDASQIDGGVAPPIQRISKTDAMGRYSFYKLPPGTYGLTAELGGDQIATEPPFRLDPGEEALRDFTLPQLGSIQLVVTNPAEQPVARARAVLYVPQPDGRDRPVRTGYSDLKGIARLKFVHEGSYKLKVQVQGFLPYEESVVIGASGGLSEIPVRLELAPHHGN